MEEHLRHCCPDWDYSKASHASGCPWSPETWPKVAMSALNLLSDWIDKRFPGEPSDA